MTDQPVPTPDAEDDEPLPQRVINAEPVPPEQIEDLIFQPNPEYPYPFEDVETPPHFWMTETTGKLANAVDAYMDGFRLTDTQLATIRVYLRQFVGRAKLAGAANRRLLLSRIDKLKSRNDVERYADEMSEYGAELF